MDTQFDESGESLREIAVRSQLQKNPKAFQRCGHLVILLLAVSVLVSRAQPIQPEVLFEFPYGIGSYLRGPEYPYGNLVEGNDGNFYGTTSGGGPSAVGTIFKMATNGVLTSLFAFNRTNGATPYAGLALGNDGNFYGTTSSGGTNGLGTIFKVTAEGALTTLVSFNGTNGSDPEAALTLGNEGSFYGTTVGGGANGAGTVFKLATDGSLTTLASFDRWNNGGSPRGSLTLGNDGRLYGTTSEGGTNYNEYNGTVFAVTTDGILTTLASFNGTNGANPHAGLTLGPDGNFYGTAYSGGSGSSASGTVFRVTTNGVLTRIANISYPTAAGPVAALTLGPDGSFYGTTGWGGNSSGYGTIFRVTTNGTFSVRVAFNGANGVEPHAGLTLGSDGNFYGTAAAGGGGGDTGGGVGTFFRMAPSGAFTKLASFGKPIGSSPRAPLTLGNDGYFYGTTSSAGSNGYGMVFKMATNGTVTTLASFNNANGAYPHTGLTLGPDGNFYGTSADGGTAGGGTVFRVTTNGTLTRLVSFTGANGSFPQAALTLGPDGNFYGTTAYSGLSGGSPTGWGTVFRLTTNGTVTRLVSFNNTNGANPQSALIFGNDGALYGTTYQGGSGGVGTVFKVTTNGILTTLFSFNAAVGQRPQGALTLGNDGNFYGLTGPGNLSGPATLNPVGTFFRMTTDGTLTFLSSFRYDNSGWLLSDLTLGPDGNYYGTTAGGSGDRPGTVFQVTTNGSFATLFSFGNTNGAVPLAPLTVGWDGNFYGTTTGGGNLWDGTIFRLRPLAPVVFGQPQPANQVLPAGLDITIGANVFGALPMSFQWVFNGSNRPGATNSWLSFSAAPSLSGIYTLRASNHLGTALSSNATVTVMPALITNLPVTGMTASGAMINASVAVGREDTLAWIEWGTNTTYGRISGVTNIAGGSGTTRLTGALTGLDETGVNHYRVVASNSFGIVYGPDQTLRLGSIYAYAQSVLADEPLVFYRFDETNGTTAVNSGFLGEPFNATYNTNVSLGVPSLTQKFGYAAEFNNTNSSVAVPALGIYTQITIEAWLKPRSFPGNEAYDSIYTTDIWSPGALTTHLVDLNAPFHRWQIAVRGSDPYNSGDFFETYVGSEGLFLTNTWVHLAASYDSTTKTMVTYVNGQAYSTNIVPNAKPLNLTAANIGAWIGGYYPLQPTYAQDWFDGQIDEFAIYPTALTGDRIWAHFKAAGNPLILAQPSSRTNDFGSTASFSVRAGVTSPFIFQWLKNGVQLGDGLQISGTFTPTLTLTSVAKAQEGDYSLWIRNASGSVTSVVARLVVVDPLITSQPTNQVAEMTGNTTFTVAAVGTPPLSYQWLQEGVPIGLATKPSLTLTNLQASDAGGYAIVVSNPFASTTSQVASLTVNLVPGDPTFKSGADQSPLAFAMQADGKILVGGQFTKLGGEARTNIARINVDGSVDPLFNPGANGGINSFAIQSDGKIVVGGYFTTLAGQPRNYIGRLNADGSLDPAFNPGTNGPIYSLAIQAEGKILVGGYLSTLGGEPRYSIVRLNGDGSVDATFNLGPGGDNYLNVNTIAVQADGKILVAGNFSMLGGQPRYGIGRLNADGSLDTTFDLGVNGPSSYYPYVDTLAVQADGKILIGAQFFKLGEQVRRAIRRYNADGSLDTSFNPGPGGYYHGYYSLALQADRKILVGGYFDSLGGQPRNNIARLNSDGSADLTFNPGTDWTVQSLALQADGKILMGGNFTTVDGQSHTNLARLNNIGLAVQNLTYDGSTLLWQRDGTGPEVSRTTFEMTTNSLAWTGLGSGVRVPNGWQLTGVTLPPVCSIRARGIANAGFHNSSSWFIEDYWGSLIVAYQPASRTNNAGTTAVFSVTAGGTEPIQYQWFKNGVPLADGGLVDGAQTPTLTLSTVLKADEGDYSLVITNFSGSITSAVARLEVVDPVIAAQPKSQQADVNGGATLNVVGVGTPPVSYQWLKDGLPLASATNANLVFTNLQLVDAAGYAAVVGNQFGSVTSAVANLTVNGGTIDPMINVGADNSIICLAEQTDGKILVGGYFTTLGGQQRNNLGRINADGDVDTRFNPGCDGSVTCLAVQVDEKILVGGYFTTLGGQQRNYLGRLNADGSLDSSFNPAPNGGILSMGIQADGKILVGGYFTMLGGQPRNYLGRLNADGSLDMAFNPEVDNSISCLVIQADGKILVGGYFTSLGGQSRTNIGRLNVDGSVDANFNPGCDGGVSSLAVQADGKILVGGNFAFLGGQSRTNIGRLNADGTVDPTFTLGAKSPEGNGSSIISLAVQADGKIVVGGYFASLGGQARTNIGRLNLDGSADLAFSPPNAGWLTTLALQPDGNILVAGNFITPDGQSHMNLVRLKNTNPATQDLTYDGATLQWLRGDTGPEVWRAAFEVTTNSEDWTSLGVGVRVPGGWQLTGVSLPASSTVRARGFVPGGGPQNSSSWFVEDYWGPPLIVSQPSSRTNNAGTTAILSIVVGGTEPQYQWFKDGTALADSGLVSGAQTATLTLTSVLKANEGSYSVVITNMSGSVTSAVVSITVIEPLITSQPTNQMAELNGSATLSVGAAGTTLKYQWLKNGLLLANATNSSLHLSDLQFSDIGAYSVVVTNQFGSLTSAVVTLTVNGTTIDPGFASGADGFVGCLAVQPDGKILVGGRFSTLGGQPRSNIGRLNADGSLDSTFKPEADRYLSSLAIQADGKILAGGGFYSLGGQPRYGIGRLNADGTLDSGFNSGYNGYGGVNSIVVQAEGKILVAGANLGRLNSDGSLDASFNVGTDSGVVSMVIQADGQIVVGGNFTTLGGQPRSYLGRVNASGALDTSFNPGADGYVGALAIQSDGKILVGGTFTTLAGQPRKNIGRLNPDGSLDTAFDPGADSGISCIAVQADGKILVGGYFSTLGGQPRHFGRLNPDGSVDATFNPASDYGVIVVALQADGEIVVGGGFTMLGGQPRNRLGRLYNTGPATEDLVYDGSSLLWHRGGTGTEIWHTTFEVTTNNVDWINLGAGTRVPGGWQLTGITLPDYCAIHARGITTGDGWGVMNWFIERSWQLGPGLQVGLGTAAVGVGGKGCLPLYVESRYGLTNLSIVVDFPQNRLTNFTVLTTAPGIGRAEIQPIGTTQIQVTLSANPGAALPGVGQLASICFEANSGQDSSFSRLELSQVLGVRENGLSIVSLSSQPGQAIVVGDSPLLQCVLQSNGQPMLFLYGQPGGYVIEQRSDDGTWTTVLDNLSVTNFSLAVPLPQASGPAGLFRARTE